MAMILWILAILGAIGGAIIVRDKIFTWARNRWHSLKARNALGDFYYTERVSSYRVHDDDRTYSGLFVDKVRPKKDIESIPFAYVWTGDGRLTEALILPTDAKIIASTDTTHIGTPVKKIHRDDGFKKGETVLCKYSVTAIIDSKRPDPVFGTSSQHRTDRLTLRVFFPANNVPESACFRITDSHGKNLHPPMQLPVDEFSGECTHTIASPQPHVRHFIDWSGQASVVATTSQNLQELANPSNRSE